MKKTKKIYCKRHGSRFVGPDIRSSLCLHPKCFRELVISLTVKYKLLSKHYQILRDWKLEDDFISYFQTRLIERFQKGNHIIFVSKMVLYYNLLMFIDREAKKILPRSYMSAFKKSKKLHKESPVLAVETWISIHESENYICTGQFEFDNGTTASPINQPGDHTPEDAAFYNELKNFITCNWGPSWVVYLKKDIGLHEMMRIQGLRANDLKKTEEEIKKQIRAWLENSYNDYDEEDEHVYIDYDD